jgi:hypothetical protein
MNVKRQRFSLNERILLSVFILIAYSILLPRSSSALTLGEVVKDLACPCECPLILEDCNMSCGLEWKDEVGQLISKGMTKEEIMDYFIETYGEEARLTTLQRIQGKTYQYTRGFGTTEWVLLWTGGGIWMVILFAGCYIGTRRFFRRG